jgi:hypothetical protein
MDVIEIKTLIDITNTEVRRINQGTQIELDQFRNWTTLLQCIGMRAIMTYDKNPISNTENIDNLGFGTEYKGVHTVWTFRFRPDREGTFADISLLKADLDQVPIILDLCDSINLTEIINTPRAVFNVSDKKYMNTVVKAI